MTPTLTTPVAFVISPGPAGPKIHKASCRRVAGRANTTPARTAPADIFTEAETATCCKPSEEAICAERRAVEPDAEPVGICAALQAVPPAPARKPRSVAEPRKAQHDTTNRRHVERLAAKDAEAAAADEFIARAHQAAAAGDLPGDPYQRAMAAKKAAHNKRGPGRPTNEATLERWMRDILAVHPDYRFRQVIEVGYWVERLAASPAKYAAAWEKITGAAPTVKHRGAA